jgi:hypothetical protein
MTHPQKIKKLLWSASVGLFLLLNNLSATAQITSTTIQPLSFGTFCPGFSGGTITVSPAGLRTTTGDVIVINQNSAIYMPAIIEVEAPIGSRITIVDFNAQLRGSNGGAMTLHISGSDPGSPFTTAASRTNVSIGGTLTIGGITTNPSGKYNGSFVINFILE